MIQEIAPHRFDNQYHPRMPRLDDMVLLYRKNRIYMQEDGKYPTVKELAEEDRMQLQYLFQMDHVAYFTLLKEPRYLPAGYAFLVTRHLRGLHNNHIAFAGISGYQLWSWYQSRMFCGSCGRSMQHDEKERMMRCTHCGNVEYPKICPAVIVGVIKGDSIILTRYAGRSYTKDALIAGFCEIGETLEQTVRREVMEEVGLKVKNIQYYKSQPWSFTDTLLMGFFCEVDGDDKIVLDENELSSARFVRREDIMEDEEQISLTGEMMQMFKHGSISIKNIENVCYNECNKKHEEEKECV